MKPSKILVAGLLGMLLGGAPVAHAGLAIANGDFQTGAGNNIDDVTDWNDNSDGTFWHGTWQTNSTTITPNGTAVVVLGSYESGAIQSTASADANGGNYLYQSIGTADGVTSLKVQFDWGAPNDDPGGRDLGITVGVYAYDGLGGFTPADNTDVRGASGVTFLGSQSFTQTSTGVDGQIGATTATLDISGAGTQQLFLRFNNYRPANTQSWTVVDNVGIVYDVPTFSTQPADFFGNVGDAVTLTAVAISDPAPTYQWEYSPDGSDPWTPLDFETEASLVLNPSYFSDNGYYRVVATNTNSSATSDAVEVNLVYPKPAIPGQPASTAVEVGGNVTLAVTATGLGNLTYQWFKDIDPIDGATSDTLELTGVQLSDSGEYSVEITDDAAEADGEAATVAYSDFATVTVFSPWSGLISEESFDTAAGYVEGELPAQNPAIAGYTGAWTDVDTGTLEPAISLGSLIYSDSLYLGSSGDKASVPHNPSGGETDAANSGRVYRLLDAPLVANDSTSDVRYLSFLFQSGQETGATTYQTLALKDSADTHVTQNFDIGICNNDGQTGTFYNFGTDNAYTSTGVAADTNVHLLVVKFDLSATAASDSVTVWVDPALGAGEPEGGTTVSGLDLSWDRLALSDYDGNSAAWDEIRWGDSFDSVTLNPNPSNDFAAWIAGFSGVGAMTGFTDDADGDGIVNGLENYFGTDPGAASAGIAQVAKTGNTVSFQHPQNAAPASDVSAAYVWSTDLVTFHADGASDGGVTVSFAASADTPVAGTTTVTATITGTVPEKLFVVLQATQGTP